jgi:carbon-monoxide dehydrogenase large subunit
MAGLDPAIHVSPHTSVTSPGHDETLGIGVKTPAGAPARDPLKRCPISRDPRTSGMNILPGNLRFGAGQPVKRLEDQRLLTGKGQFIDDKPDEGALWLHVLRSPHAHARIVSIATAAAAAMPGVTASYTGADLVKDDIGSIPTLSIFKRPDGKPMTVPPRRLLAHEVVRYAGEAVAAVVAALKSTLLQT